MFLSELSFKKPLKTPVFLDSQNILTCTPSSRCMYREYRYIAVFSIFLFPYRTKRVVFNADGTR
nr:MAG TPA: hypothetical protein [Caudoviricetes sp.]